MAAKKKRDRTVRRENDRAVKKDLSARLALAKLEPGGAPSRPLVVTTASLVEPSARAKPCVACGESVRVADHTAETREGRSVRVAHLECPMCGLRRELFFVIEEPLLN